MRFLKLLLAALIGAASLAAAAPRDGGSDVPPDPAVRSGVLPNGLHYQILRNATPPHNAALRLRIDAGSLNEREDERGVAHFVEHMAMSGTRNVPEGEMVKRLERAGLRFGPDTNAFTDFRQTYYALNLPETDAATLDTALTLLREVASEASFTADAVERQRGVILSEERSRASPAARSGEEELRFLLKGDLLPQRVPIGLPDVIRTVPRDRLFRFYESHYRPERATLIAVGDFDPAKMEADIRRLFGTWRGSGRAGDAARPSAVHKRAVEAHLLVDPALPPRVTLAWLSPPDLRPDSRLVREERLVSAIGLAAFNRRVARLNSLAPLVAASAGRSSFFRRADATLLNGIAKPGEWKGALQRLVRDQRTLVAGGLTKAETDREVAALRTALSVAASGATTRDTSTLAQLLLAADADHHVFSTPEEALAELDAAAPKLTPESVSAATRALFEAGGPLIFATSPTAIEGGEGALTAAFVEANTGPINVTAAMGQPAAAARPWPYTSFGPAGPIAERRTLDSLGAMAVRFSNGVRLTVKKTAFAKDEINVAVRIGHGKFDLSPEEVPAAFALSTGAFIQGGLGKIDAEALRDLTTSRVSSASFAIGDDASVLSGRTRAADLDFELQLLAAYASDAAIRPGPWTPVRSLAGTLSGQLASSPGGVLARDGQRLLHGGDVRWGVPAREDLAAVSPTGIRGFLAQLRLGPIEIVIVGDVDVEAAIKAVGSTFGALPARAELPAPAGRMAISFPKPDLVRAYHKGRADQGLAFIAWPTADFYSDQKRARTLNLLGGVFRLRLLDEIREKLGVSYSPSAGHTASETIPGFGYASVAVEAPPEKLDSVFAAATRIAATLREQPVSADELDRARRPVIENFNRERNGNAFWLGRLAGVQTRPAAIAAITDMLPQYESVTPADIQAAARAYLIDAKAWKLAVVPEKTP